MTPVTLAVATLAFLDPSGPELPAHEFALLWPELTPTEFEQMVTDIAAHGVRNPILLYDEDGTRFSWTGSTASMPRVALANPVPTPCLRATALPPLPRRIH